MGNKFKNLKIFNFKFFELDLWVGSSDQTTLFSVRLMLITTKPRVTTLKDIFDFILDVF